MSQIGKFEGEPEWVSLLWDRALSGFSDNQVYDGSTAFDGFNLTPEVAELTGYDPDETRCVVLWESDDGYVSHNVLTVSELLEIEGREITDELIDPDFDDLEFGGEG